MLSIGVDIIEVSRFSNARFVDRVAEFFLTPQEFLLAKGRTDKHQFFASRFALKEAVIKAIPEAIEFYDFEIIKNNRKPEVRFLNDRYNKYTVAVSLSHSLTSAIGFAVAQY